MKKTLKIVAIMLVAVMSLAVLVACAPNADPDKAVAALKEAGYDANKIPSTGLFGKECYVVGSKTFKDDDGNIKVEFVMIYYYKTNEDAQSDWESIKAEADKSDKKDDSDWEVGSSGKMIWYGTSAAIKAAR